MRTQNIYLAAYVKALGKKVKIIREYIENKKHFSFEVDCTPEEKSSFHKNAQIGVIDLVSSIRSIKAEMTNDRSMLKGMGKYFKR